MASKRLSSLRHLIAIALLVLPATCMLALQSAAAPSTDTYDIELRGSISPDKLGTHEMLAFNVPAGIQRMEVSLISPGFQKVMYLTAGLFDPQRYRGEGRSHFTISPVDATGPYLAGPIIPGTWHIAIRYNYLAPQAHGEFSVQIHLSKQLDPAHYPVINPQARLV